MPGPRRPWKAFGLAAGVWVIVEDQITFSFNIIPTMVQESWPTPTTLRAVVVRSVF